MKIIRCPLNGPRNAQEFFYGGDVLAEPDADAPARAWSNYVFLEDNSRGVADEWWCHAASSYWFILRRDRATDEILDTFTVDEYFEREDPA